MIIKHIVELETVISENSDEPSAKAILGMSEQTRQEFLDEAASELIATFLAEANSGNSWAELRVAK